MCCEHLICAACAGPVVEAGCPTCRLSRAGVHHDGPHVHVPEWLVAAAVLLITVAVLLAA